MDLNDLTPEQRLEHWRTIDWYMVTIQGINAQGKEDTAVVKMSGDIDFTVECWANDKGWFQAAAVSQEPVPYYTQ